MTIRVGTSIGVDHVLSQAGRAGLLETKVEASPVALLGPFESSPIRVASSYSVFPNRGLHHTPRLIRKIVSAGGELLYSATDENFQAIASSAAWPTSQILREVMKSGTATSAGEMGLGNLPAHGKTGTTNDYKDTWFAGFSDKISCAVWVAMDQPQSIMNRGYGSTLALPIWTEVMNTAEEAGFPAEPAAPPR